MELIGSLFLVLAVALLVGLFVARPFLRTGGAADERAGTLEPQEHLRSSLLAERDRVLNALQDLDFDHAMGKVPEEEYPDQRAVLLQTGTEVLRRLDIMENASLARPQGAGALAEAQRGVEERIEAAVAARRADARTGLPTRAAGVAAIGSDQSSGAAHSGNDLEEMIAVRKRQRQEPSAGFCPKCGKAVQKSDLFCGRCGTTL